MVLVDRLEEIINKGFKSSKANKYHIFGVIKYRSNAYVWMQTHTCTHTHTHTHTSHARTHARTLARTQRHTNTHMHRGHLSTLIEFTAHFTTASVF